MVRAGGGQPLPPASGVANGGAGALWWCSFSLCPAGGACRKTLTAALACSALAPRLLPLFLCGQETFELLPVPADVLLLTVALYNLA